jgi:hypothetical protein
MRIELHIQRMRIFVYEFICGGGLAGRPLPESLQHEGWAMLTAVLEDFCRCPGVDTVSMLDARLPTPESWNATTMDKVEEGAEQSLFCKRARSADFTFVIAPEFSDLLYQRCCWVEKCGGRLLGPGSQAVALTGDKLKLARVWQHRGVPTPMTAGWKDRQGMPFPMVRKPQWGAGSCDIVLLQNDMELEASHRASSQQGNEESIVQAFAPGVAVSVSILLGGGHRVVLPASSQRLSDDGRFGYLGGSLPLSDNLNDRAQSLAMRAIAPIGGLAGYVGVDLVLGDADDGSKDFAIEINPRLTTSYVGLRAFAKFNLAETILALALGRPLPERRYRDTKVEWGSKSGLTPNDSARIDIRQHPAGD